MMPTARCSSAQYPIEVPSITRRMSRLVCESRGTGAGWIIAATDSAGGGVMRPSSAVRLFAPHACEIGDGGPRVEHVQLVIGAALALRRGLAHVALPVLPVA